MGIEEQPRGILPLASVLCWLFINYASPGATVKNLIEGATRLPVLGTASILLEPLIEHHPKTQQDNPRPWAMLHPETGLPQYTI